MSSRRHCRHVGCLATIRLCQRLQEIDETLSCMGKQCATYKVFETFCEKRDPAREVSFTCETVCPAARVLGPRETGKERGSSMADHGGIPQF